MAKRTGKEIVNNVHRLIDIDAKSLQSSANSVGIHLATVQTLNRLLRFWDARNEGFLARP